MRLPSERHWPELLPRYQMDYWGRAYLPAEKVKPVQQLVGRLADRHGVGRRPVEFLRPAPEPQQLSLLA